MFFYLRSLLGVHVGEAAPDKRLIDLNGSPSAALIAAQLFRALILHGLANSVQHKPSRVLANAKVFGKLVATHSVLAVGQHPNRHHPFVEANGRVLHHRAHLDRELLFADVAEPQATGFNEGMLRLSAARAGYIATRPAELDSGLKSALRIGKVGDCFLECLGSVHVEMLH